MALVAMRLSSVTALPAAAPDLVLVGGKVFTPDPARRFAEALAIRSERITAVGFFADIRKLAGLKTRLIELHGRVVVPGFNDAHAHHEPMPRTFALPLTFPDPSWDEVLAELAAPPPLSDSVPLPKSSDARREEL